MAAPYTVWRIRLQDGSLVHCVLSDRSQKTTVVWQFYIELGSQDPHVFPPGHRLRHRFHAPRSLALLTSKWVEVQVGATRSYAIWAVTA